MRKVLLFSAMAAVFICPLLLVLIPARADAGPMQWTTAVTPDSTDYVIVSPSEVNVIAVSPDGVTVYASDIPNKKLYKSVNSGYGWTDISNSLEASGASLPVWNIKVAPDNPSVMAAITSSGGSPRAVFFSSDGGSNWQNLNCRSDQDICALDISPFYGAYDIIAGTRNSGGGMLYTFKMMGTGTWSEQPLADILDAKFSPNYSADNSVVIIYANAMGTFAGIGLRDLGGNTTNFGTWGPMEITTGGAGSSPHFNQIKTASIELPSDFNGQISSLRKFFLSTNDGGLTGNAGIFRIDDNVLFRIMPPGNRQVSSISYYGTTTSGKLLEGEVKANTSTATVDVQYCLNAAANCPQGTCLTWQKSLKLPTGGAVNGNANAQVKWSRDGNRAFCGTSSADISGAGWPAGLSIGQALDESAFSYSADGAVSWNQVGLIDTRITFLSDVIATPATDAVYLSSINNAGPGFDSLWKRSASSAWERILTLLSPSNQLMTRINSNKPNQVFLALPSTSSMLGSPDSGQTWTTIQPGTNITDFQVLTTGAMTSVFVLSGSTVRRGDFSGTIWKWGPPVSTRLMSGHMIYVDPAGIVLVGDTQGGVAFSIDAGNQFSTLPPLPVPGNVAVILDDRVKNPYLIHAATDNPSSSIYAWILGGSSSWFDMQPPLAGYYSLAQFNTFYGCASDASGSAVVRTLQPEQISGSEWDIMRAGLPSGVVFTREPSAISVSSGVVLLAIDNRPYTAATGRLWQYGDMLTGNPGIAQLPPTEFLIQAPLLSSPSPNAVIEPTVSGEIPSIVFRWQQSSSPNGYDLWIARDPDFNQVVLKQSVIPDNVITPKWVLETANSFLETGQTYYWKVRVNRIAYTYQKVEGIWSAASSFSIPAISKPEITPPAAPVLLYPPDNAAGVLEPVSFTWSPVAGVTEYEFTLASDAQMRQVLVNAKTQALEYRHTAGLGKDTTYYWQVKAIKPAAGQPGPVFSFIAGKGPQGVPVQKGWYSGIPFWVYAGCGIFLIVLIVIITALVSRRKYNS